MKMKKSDVDYLYGRMKETVDRFGNKERELFTYALERGEMAYRWNLMWRSKVDLGDIYTYCNDDHIDTALRRIMKALSCHLSRVDHICGAVVGDPDQGIMGFAPSNPET